MKKTLIVLAALLIAVSCNRPSAVVDLNLKDAPGADVQLYRLDINKLSLVEAAPRLPDW